MPEERSFTIAEAARAAMLRARAVAEGAAVTTGVEIALAADRRRWAHRLLGRLNNLPVTAIDEINHSIGKETTHA